MQMKNGYSINDGWLIAEAGMLGNTEMTMRLIGDEGEEVEVYSPAGRQIVTLSNLPANISNYLNALRDQTTQGS